MADATAVLRRQLAEIDGLAKDAGVPLVAVFVPNRAQAAMISRGDWPAGYDPFKLEHEVRDSIVKMVDSSSTSCRITVASRALSGITFP